MIATLRIVTIEKLELTFLPSLNIVPKNLDLFASCDKEYVKI